MFLKVKELPVAFMSDIDGMFMQCAVRQEAQCVPSTADNKFFGASSSSFFETYVLQKVQKTKSKRFQQTWTALSPTFIRITAYWFKGGAEYNFWWWKPVQWNSTEDWNSPRIQYFTTILKSLFSGFRLFDFRNPLLSKLIVMAKHGNNLSKLHSKLNCNLQQVWYEQSV